ncbi:hypothetical protein ABMA67_02435 [Halobacteriovorax sp. RZ-3]|uniref:DUF6414 family protein n=1 Tax=Halobacteriovorax sp. RZ-3 TaxID=3157720 RepID=UPI003711FC7C
MKEDQKQLILPVYLNQRITFDLIAMIEDGISEVSSVTTSSSLQTEEERRIGASFGLGQALSGLLKIGLDGNQASMDSSSADQSVVVQKVHTPASLFYKLRNALNSKNLIKLVDSDYMPREGDFIEFEGVFKRNSLLESMDMFEELIELAIGFSPNQKGKGKSQDNGLSLIKKQIKKIKECLVLGDSIDMTSKIPYINYDAVVTLETPFLNDPTMADIAEGKFRVLGKVIKCHSDNSGAIKLLRKTALSKMPDSAMAEFIGTFETLGTQGFNIPEMSLEVSGPVVHIIPLAIFS